MEVGVIDVTAMLEAFELGRTAFTPLFPCDCTGPYKFCHVVIGYEGSMEQHPSLISCIFYPHGGYLEA